MGAGPRNERPPPLVLVVDDSPVARLAVARRLRAEGFEVLEQASAETPDGATIARLACALLDLDLGDSDGAQLAGSLRRSHAELPVAFFSASVSGEVLARARALGPVFTKPGELDAAIAWVSQSAGTRA
jgi:CheY-like chemotaxis protein